MDGIILTENLPEINYCFSFYPPCHFIINFKSGVKQEVRGSFQEGYWTIEKMIFTINFPFENEEPVVKELNPELVKNINWQLVLEKWENKDYTNLPTRMEFEQMKIEDFLISIGVLQLTVNPNVMINGQPARNFSINSEYQMAPAAHQSLEIIDITQTANPRSAEKKEKS